MMMDNKSAFLVLAILLAAFVTAEKGGTVVSLTESGVEYIAQESIAEIDAHFAGQRVTIPNQSGSHHHDTWSLTNIVLSDMHIGSGKASLVSGTGVALSTSDITAQVTADWKATHHHFPHFSGHGKLTVKISSTSATVVMRVGGAAGHLDLSVASASVSIGHLSLHFSGSIVSDLLNLIKGAIEGPIKKEMESGIENALKGSVSKTLEKLVSTWPMHYSIQGTPLAVSYGVEGAVNTTSTHVSGALSGYTYWQKNATVPAGMPSGLPGYVGVAPAPMIEVVLSEWSLDTVGPAGVQSGFLRYEVTDKMVPASAPVNLNTSSWKTLAPPLFQKYPDHLMTATVYPAVGPDFVVSPKGVNMTAQVNVALRVLLGDTSVPAFTIGIDVSIFMVPSVTHNNVTATITGQHVTSSIVSSQVGSFDDAQLNGLIVFGAAEGVQVAAPLLKQGYPLPMFEGFELKNPQILNKAGYFVVSAAIEKA